MFPNITSGKFPNHQKGKVLWCSYTQSYSPKFVFQAKYPISLTAKWKCYYRSVMPSQQWALRVCPWDNHSGQLLGQALERLKLARGHWTSGRKPTQGLIHSWLPFLLQNIKSSSTPPRRAKHQTLRIEVENDLLFYYEWCHPGEEKAYAQELKLLNPGFKLGSGWVFKGIGGPGMWTC